MIGLIKSKRLHYSRLAKAWFPIANFPSPTWAGVAVLLPNGKIYIGPTGGGGLSLVGQIYDPATNTYTEATTGASNDIYFYGMCLLSNGKVIHAGGVDVSAQIDITTVLLYDPVDDTIEAKASLPFPRKHSRMLSVGDEALCFGGANGNTVVDTVYTYVPATDTWNTSRATMPAVRESGVVARHGDYIYYFGGRAALSSSNSLNTIFRYNITTDAWTTLATTMPAALFAASLAVVDGKFWIMGGAILTGSGGTRTDSAETYVFDPSTELFVQDASGAYAHADLRLPYVRGSLAGVTPINNDVYLFGGNDGAVGTPSSFVYKQKAIL